MNVRDAREGDAPALGTIADAPADVLRSVIHDRTVRVAEVPAAAVDGAAVVSGPDGDPITLPGPSADRSPSGETPSSADESPVPDADGPLLAGFVSFDARDVTVFVTQLEGTARACRRLLDEPIRFAETESMAVEAVVPASHETAIEALLAAGFEETGSGPRFDGAETRQFRLEA